MNIKTFIYYLLPFFVQVLSAQIPFSQRYKLSQLDTTIIKTKTTCFDKTDTLYCIPKVVYKNRLIISLEEIAAFNGKQTSETADTISFPDKISFVLIKENTYEILNFNMLIQKEISEYKYPIEKLFFGKYEDISLYEIPNTNLADAIGIILFSDNRIPNKLQISTRSVVLAPDTIDDNGLIMHYLSIDLDKDKTTDICFTKGQPLKKNISDSLFRTDEINAYLIRNKKYYLTGYYWLGQDGVYGY